MVLDGYFRSSLARNEAGLTNPDLRGATSYGGQTAEISIPVR